MMQSLILLLHIASGGVAVAAGAVALFSAKGSTVHRGAGNLFFGSMLAMAAAGTYLAWVAPMMITVLAGLFTGYLVATSWMTVRRPEGVSGPFDIAAFLVALAIGAGGFFYGFEATNSETGLVDGFSAGPYFFFGGLALLAAAGDALLIVRRGISGAQRIARHLWRMCLALYFAVGSLFTGPGASAFPESLQGSAWLSAPEMIVAAMMLFWLVRVLFTRWWTESVETKTAGAAPNASS
ncbi:hypothetical protein [Parasphingopyxis lamellibrachiae]|nr:hypothetical protein [Parasphingopyxis lamellibrachiae]